MIEENRYLKMFKPKNGRWIYYVETDGQDSMNRQLPSRMHRPHDAMYTREDRRLEHYGFEGWELVAVVPDGEGEYKRYKYYYKKLVSEEEFKERVIRREDSGEEFLPWLEF